MMSVLLTVSIVLGILVLILAGIGMTLPAIVSFEEKVLINVPVENAFLTLSDLHKFPNWSPWSEKDPNMKAEFTGEKCSVGQRYSWKGNNKVGSGFMEIAHLEANKRVDLDLNFGPRGNSKCGFLLNETEENTEVTWYFSSDMGNSPFSRLMGPLMKKFVVSDYKKGLAKLKHKLES